MDKRPEKDSCINCGREVTKDKDFTLIELNIKGDDCSFWQPYCRWCRGVNTKNIKRITKS